MRSGIAVLYLLGLSVKYFSSSPCGDDEDEAPSMSSMRLDKLKRAFSSHLIPATQNIRRTQTHSTTKK